jgi:hypothetical protein
METTIWKKLLGLEMEIMFEKQHKVIMIKFYQNNDMRESDEFQLLKKYNYGIQIRHPEETNANELFDEALAAVRKSIIKALKEDTVKKESKSGIEILLFYKTKDSDLALGMRVVYADVYGQFTKTGVITHIDATRPQKLYCVNSGSMAAQYTADELKLIKKP